MAFFMKKKDWSDFVISCSGIGDIMTRPKGATQVTSREWAKYEKYLSLENRKDSESAFIEKILQKDARFKDPELSQVAIRHLVKKYAWFKYNKKTPFMGTGRSTVSKGNELEVDAISMLSKLDKVDYKKPDCFVSNDYIMGMCDVLCMTNDKIIDVKTSWSIYSFLPHRLVMLDKKYWMQMQGYLDIYNLDRGEVCFILLNTPAHLVERERARYTEKYLFGEISNEKFQEEIEKLDLAFNYDKIPPRRRVIRFEVHRSQEFIDKVHKRVEKCRVWLNEFERIHLTNKKIKTSYLDYEKQDTEDNIEIDT